jgi:hypothetical protein
MNQEEVIFDLYETVLESLPKINEIGLRKILENFETRVRQISSGNSIAFILMNKGLTEYKFFRYWMEESFKIPGFDKRNPDHMSQLYKLIGERFEIEHDKNFEHALESVQEFRKEDAEFKEASYNNSLNSLVNIWTAFEATIKSLWAYSLDNYPKLFINEVLRHKGSTEVAGIDGKSISIGLLAKYDFNISNCLGSVMNEKFDFTSISGIKKALNALLGDNETIQSSFNDPSLTQLEITRNLIVHSAGIIDNDYLKRTSRIDEKIGKRIDLSVKELCTYGNSCLNPTVSLALELDRIIHLESNVTNK